MLVAQLVDKGACEQSSCLHQLPSRELATNFGAALATTMVAFCEGATASAFTDKSFRRSLSQIASFFNCYPDFVNASQPQ